MTENSGKNSLQEKQALRIRRMAMAFATYLVPLFLTLLCWYLEMMPFYAVAIFAFLVLIIHGIFLYLFRKEFNLRFTDPSLTAPQMTAAVILALSVMYFLEPGQARAAFMMIVAVPPLYGILALNTKRFLKICLLFFFLYGALMLVLWQFKPEVLNPSLELIQAIAFLLIMTTIAIVGGFISGLREKVRTRNRELREAIARIEELVNIDALTGVCNRRWLFEVLVEESNRYNRARSPFSVCILDIDHFKRVNDSFGHLAGDDILNKIAKNLSENTRIIDTFGRYGGEEFLLIMPYTSLAGAAVKAERVRGQVAAMDFSEISPDLRITVSAGLAEYRQGEDIDTTIVRADNALYAAKEAGRNRVVTEKELESNA